MAAYVCSKWFEGTQGLRQGCELFPLLSTVFFAAILLVVLLLVRSSEDADILSDFGHLQEQPSKVGPEKALEYAQRAIWRMLHADDACIVSRSPNGMKWMMLVFVEAFDTFGPTIS